jgi:hypothetical protein
MGFLDKLKKKVQANTAKKTKKILGKSPKKGGVQSAGKLVDKAFAKGNTLGKAGKVLKSKKK